MAVCDRADEMARLAEAATSPALRHLMHAHAHTTRRVEALADTGFQSAREAAAQGGRGAEMRAYARALREMIDEQMAALAALRQVVSEAAPGVRDVHGAQAQ